jgi:site-specific recombinase XerD
MNTPSHFRSLLAGEIERFLSHHRALGKRFDSEEHALRLLDHFLLEHNVQALEQITPAVLEAFLASRPRTRARSYNHLLNVLQRLFRWLVAQHVFPRSPLHARARRSTQHRAPFLFEPAQIERLLDCAAKLRDGPHTRHRGITYRMIFALMYGLGLRVSEVARLCRKDLDLERRCLHIRQTKFA